MVYCKFSLLTNFTLENVKMTICFIIILHCNAEYSFFLIVQIHIAIILPMICMYTTGMAAIFRQRPVLGFSYNNFANQHRLIGYCLFFVVLFEIATGMIRPRNILLRRIVITLHWLGGLLLNYVGRKLLGMFSNK